MANSLLRQGAGLLLASQVRGSSCRRVQPCVGQPASDTAVQPLWRPAHGPFRAPPAGRAAAAGPGPHSCAQAVQHRHLVRGWVVGWVGGWWRCTPRCLHASRLPPPSRSLVPSACSLALSPPALLLRQGPRRQGRAPRRRAPGGPAALWRGGGGGSVAVPLCGGAHRAAGLRRGAAQRRRLHAAHGWAGGKGGQAGWRAGRRRGGVLPGHQVQA